MSGKLTVAERRKQRIRNELKARNNGRPRLVGDALAQEHLRAGHR
jgi:hypothetical protein